MGRYKNRGWFGESHRHYLASKGIKTKRDNRQYFANVFSSESVGDMEKEVRERDVAQKKEEVLQELTKRVNQGRMTGENREWFMKHKFKSVAEDYLNGVIDKEKFDKKMERELDNYKKTHDRNFPFMDFVQGKA